MAEYRAVRETLRLSRAVPPPGGRRRGDGDRGRAARRRRGDHLRRHPAGARAARCRAASSAPATGRCCTARCRSPEDVARLAAYDVDDALGFVYDAVRRARQGLAGRVPLIGFSGAPFTLASYLIEGGGSRQYVRTKSFMYEHPAAWHDLLGLLARLINAYLRGQIAAGADAVQLFDSWVGCLSPDDYRTHACCRIRARRCRASARWRRSFTSAPTPAACCPCHARGRRRRHRRRLAHRPRRRLDAIGFDRAIQGNLDPVDAVRPARRDPPPSRRHPGARRPPPRPHLQSRPRHPAETPVDHVRALVDAVHELSA